MYFYLECCVAVWIVATTLVQGPTDESRDSADNVELLRLEDVWNDAHIRGDVDTLNRLWARDFVVTVPNMKIMTKPEVIGAWRSGRIKFQRYQTSEIRIHIYAGTAVVTGRLQRTRNFNGRDIADDWRFTKVYVRLTGRWQVVAFHASTVAP